MSQWEQDVNTILREAMSVANEVAESEDLDVSDLPNQAAARINKLYVEDPTARDYAKGVINGIVVAIKELGEHFGDDEEAILSYVRRLLNQVKQ